MRLDVRITTVSTCRESEEIERESGFWKSGRNQLPRLSVRVVLVPCAFPILRLCRNGGTGGRKRKRKTSQGQEQEG